MNHAFTLALQEGDEVDNSAFIFNDEERTFDMANYFGNRDNNSYTGTRSCDAIFGFNGNDILSGNGEDDFISGGDGRDRLLREHERGRFDWTGRK
jgi:Ca2+-binding RTX toxin-like protein